MNSSKYLSTHNVDWQKMRVCCHEARLLEGIDHLMNLNYRIINITRTQHSPHKYGNMIKDKECWWEYEIIGERSKNNN